jgi:hypothetical protein
VILGLPFLSTYPESYLSRAFELSRVFTHTWTVNWKFLPPAVFTSKPLAVGLLAAHLGVLLVFAHFIWLSDDGGLPRFLSNLLFFRLPARSQSAARTQAPNQHVTETANSAFAATSGACLPQPETVQRASGATTSGVVAGGDAHAGTTGTGSAATSTSGGPGLRVGVAAGGSVPVTLRATGTGRSGTASASLSVSTTGSGSLSTQAGRARSPARKTQPEAKGFDTPPSCTAATSSAVGAAAATTGTGSSDNVSLSATASGSQSLPVPLRDSPIFIVYCLFTCNFVGIVFSRTLHYQFYSWYFHALPWLLWGATDLPIPLRLAVMAGIEYAFNVGDATGAATPLSSAVLQQSHWLLLAALLFAGFARRLPARREKNE